MLYTLLSFLLCLCIVQLAAIVASADCLGGTEMAVIVKDMVEPLLQRLSAIVVQQTDGKLQRGRRHRESNGVFGEIGKYFIKGSVSLTLTFMKEYFLLVCLKT